MFNEWHKVCTLMKKTTADNVSSDNNKLSVERCKIYIKQI
ncbi:Protein of unknown function [Bacillus mobilis]|nr:Protein of unknown function [Bacillus mobilis]